MNKSSSIKELATALAQAQPELPAVQFNAVNPFLKNKYADLGAIISTARPVLAKYGLSVSQVVETDDERVGVTTILMHSSGEWLEGTATMATGEERGKSAAQVAGSVVTYLRRYSLASILGMYADEDGDGSAPKTAATEKPPLRVDEQPQSASNVKTSNTTPPANGNGHMTIEDAEAIENSKGVRYGAIDTPTLAHMVNAMVTKGDPANDRKITAARMIMAARGEGRKVQEA